ncbi:hypothetical protein GJ496_007254 [Pomphorhynchus laevis]|nr:hypothetical protein GJ496_007254 [Pomphorhynchus laevis]
MDKIRFKKKISDANSGQSVPETELHVIIISDSESVLNDQIQKTDLSVFIELSKNVITIHPITVYNNCFQIVPASKIPVIEQRSSE